MFFARRAPSDPSPVSTGTRAPLACTCAPAVAPSFSSPTPSSTPTAAGRASTHPRRERPSRSTSTAAILWFGPRSPARTAEGTWATSSTTAPTRPVFATASTPLRSSWTPSLEKLPDDRARFFRLPRPVSVAQRYRPLDVDVEPRAEILRAGQNPQGQLENLTLHLPITGHAERMPVRELDADDARRPAFLSDRRHHRDDHGRYSGRFDPSCQHGHVRAAVGIGLLALEIERRLPSLDVEARRGEQRDPRRGQPLFERRPHGRGLAGKWPAPFVHGPEAARQESVTVDDHPSNPTSVPLTTGITAPPTSIRVGMSPSLSYSSRMLMMLRRPILVPCSLTSETLREGGTKPYLTAKAPSGPLADPVAGSSAMPEAGATIRL